MNKVADLSGTASAVEKLRAGGKKIVFTNGCFDLLHVGHVRYLERARALGDVLVVGLNGDASVRELKGDNRPVNGERDRAEVVGALACVDLVAIFPEKRATKVLDIVRPDIYAKGGDYTPETLDPEERAVLQKLGARIEIIPFEKGYSTTQLLGRLGCP